MSRPTGHHAARDVRSNPGPPPANPGWHALGTRDLGAHVRVLERLVTEMDRRIERIPAGHDNLPITVENPLIIAALEEFAGLARLLGTANRDLEKRARMLLGRLFGESRKAGIRLWLTAQRADANIIGGLERDQASHMISFRVGNLAAWQMLHQDTDKAIAAEHATARPGVALMSAPGVPLMRFLAPHITYADFYAALAPFGRHRRSERRMT